MVVTSNCTYLQVDILRCFLPVGAVASGPVVVEVGGLFNLSTVVPALAASLGVTPNPAAWGTVVTLTAPELGAAQPTAVALAVDPNYMMDTLPCAQLTVVNASAVRCKLRQLRSEWYAAPSVVLGARVSFDALIALLSPPTLALRMAAPVVTSQNVTTWGPPANVTYTVPQPLLSAAELAAEGLPTSFIWQQGVRVWVNGGPALTCAFVAPTHITCAALAGTTPLHNAVVELFGLMNLTSTSTVVVVATPAAPAWGDVVTLTAPAIGLVAPAAMNWSVESDPATAFPCANVTAVAADTLRCSLRFLLAAWLQPAPVPLTLSLAFPAVSPTTLVPAPALGVAPVPPTPVSVFLLTYITPAVLLVTVPQPAWGVGEFLAVGVAPTPAQLAVTAWVAGVPAYECTYVTPTRIRCFVTVAAAQGTAVVISVGGMFNMTGTAVVYDASTVTAAPASAAHGDTLTATLPQLPGAALSVLNLTHTPAAGATYALPCAALTLQPPHTVTCVSSAVSGTARGWAPCWHLLARTRR